MYKNKNGERNNICGENIARLRKAHVPKLSQRALSDALLFEGLDIDKNGIQRIESGQRFVTDIELKVLANYFKVSVDELLRNIEPNS